MSRLFLSRRPASWAGQLIGILTLETSIPYVPGNVSNATSFEFPVLYRTISGASIDRLLYGDDTALLDQVIAAAEELERLGVHAVTGACGFMARFQRQVTAALNIPVFLSSLLQIPLLFAITQRPIGIITADDRRLSQKHFAACGISPEIPLVMRGMQDAPEFSTAILRESGSLDSNLIESEVVAVARDMIAQSPTIATILLECSDLPPYARAIQRAVNRPVYDYITMINWIAAGLKRQEFSEE